MSVERERAGVSVVCEVGKLWKRKPKINVGTSTVPPPPTTTAVTSYYSDFLTFAVKSPFLFFSYLLRFRPLTPTPPWFAFFFCFINIPILPPPPTAETGPPHCRTVVRLGAFPGFSSKSAGGTSDASWGGGGVKWRKFRCKIGKFMKQTNKKPKSTRFQGSGLSKTEIGKFMKQNRGNGWSWIKWRHIGSFLGTGVKLENLWNEKKTQINSVDWSWGGG